MSVREPFGVGLFIVLGVAVAGFSFSADLSNDYQKMKDAINKEAALNYEEKVFASTPHRNITIYEYTNEQTKVTDCYMSHNNLGFLARWNGCQVPQYVLLDCENGQDYTTCKPAEVPKVDDQGQSKKSK